MPKLSLVLFASLFFLSTSPAIEGWGFEPHRFIANRAIDLVPEPIRPFYQRHRTFVVEHAIDPDLWRSAGFEDEPPRHFLDMDAYGPYPFEALPRDLDEAIAKYGRETVERFGLLPWRVAEFYQKLVEAFEQEGKGRVGYARDNILFYSAVLAHYVGDAHVPFHAALNYDGQLTGQHGIHARFETELFERYQQKLTITPGPLMPVPDARTFIFDALLSGFRLVDGVLKADRTALGTSDVYDDRYFDKFFESTRPVLEQRLAQSIAGVASVIAAAWEKAGKPPVAVDKPRTIRRRSS